MTTEPTHQDDTTDTDAGTVDEAPTATDRGRGDRGATTVEVLSWSAMLVVAIVAIAAALQVLGVEVIDYVRDQIGV